MSLAKRLIRTGLQSSGSSEERYDDIMNALREHTDEIAEKGA